MNGSVYCVVFSDGTIKAGFTAGQQYKRLRSHEQSAKAFGLSFEMAFFSEMHGQADESEARLIGWLSKRLEKRSKEYFSGGSVTLAREAMLSLGLLVAWVDSVQTVGGGLIVNPSLNPEASASAKRNLEDKLVEFIASTGKEGVQHGVLKNRFRGKPVEFLLQELTGKGMIDEERSIHKANKREVVRYFAIHQPLGE